MQTFPARQSHFARSLSAFFSKNLLVIRQYKRNSLIGVFVVAAMLLAIAGVSGQQFTFIPNGTFFSNPNGASETYSTTSGGIDLTGPFFQSLGTNGRSCATCHQPSDGMSVAAANVQQRFAATQGLDPIFRTNDGSNCNHNIDVSALAGRSAAYSLLRTRGLIRVAIEVPPNADYQVVSVQNPYGCNESDVISQYRRPLPATNLRFLSTVMFDGRESSPLTGTTKILYDANNPLGSLVSDLTHQAMDATNGHAQASPPVTLSDARLPQIVNLEMALYSAQIIDNLAGRLDARGATGGPVALTTNPFFISINSSVDPLAPDVESPGGLVAPGDGQFSSAIFNPYDAWASMPASSPRAAVARGQAIFNSKPINIAGVAGINDPVAAGGLGVGDNPPLRGTCGTCHDTPNVGNHSFPTPLDIGTGDPDLSNSNVNKGGLDIRYLPSITVCKLDLTTNPPSPTSNCKTTTDLGQALIDGKFDHVGKVKGPILRGLSARAPYFHNGSAGTLLDVLHFYETRFGVALTPQEESDLVAFLSSL